VAVKFLAVIFDMDGVIADSEPLYHQGLNEVLRDFGLSISEEQHTALLGMTVPATWDAIFEWYSPPVGYDECIARYDKAMVRLLSVPRSPLPGARELLTELKRRGVPRALASSSLPNWVEALLKSTGLDDCFDATVSSTSVANGKPAPDIFLYTAEKLGVEPERCVVLEDSRTGVAAAKAAGMFAVQVRAASTALPPLPEADLVLERLSDFPLPLLD
jgi:HAD superfamily hydrolase (TIGR01509 family)